MKSTKNSRAVIVGIFILLGIAILVVTILTLGGQRKTFQKSIVVRAVFDDINGLQKGNNIWFSGVKIGTVKKISFYGNSQVEVDMNIEENAREYIRKNAKARISSEGLIGNRIIAIDAGGAKSPPVENGDMIGVEKAINPDEMMNTLQSNNRNLLEITNDFKLVSRGIAQGKGTAGRLLADDRLINELLATMAMLRKASSNAQRISSSVADYASQLNRKGTLASDLVTDTIVFARLKATATQMQEASAAASSVVNNLNNTTKGLNTSLNNPNTPVGMLLNDEDAAADIRVMLRNMQSASIKLNEDLEAVQHNFLLRGFFKKKAKQEAQEAKNKQIQAPQDSIVTR
ncbi:MAG: ABC transporter, substrate-binding protein (cluster 9, phospholipid) [uncultured Segetibacter sp.]|uniref:ABC transporter, substrate-binding protein (Cluster 9, phospholipid) n=1 Tax=uncultured Segetibacter sp. TaxID=481133 RepID=A0A6J4U0P6_9BACT|nr:MAG: ABC transporter, substrate-binding protein (cluster 9, phospholipid) [uncultured Segetibacter sp.]